MNWSRQLVPLQVQDPVSRKLRVHRQVTIHDLGLQAPNSFMFTLVPVVVTVHVPAQADDSYLRSFKEEYSEGMPPSN